MPDSINLRVSGVFMITPIGARDTEPTPPNGTTSMSFSQSATRMSAGIATSTLARSKAARSLEHASTSRPSSWPNWMNVAPPMWRMKEPGASMKQKPPQTPADGVLRAERRRRARSDVSTPFCSGTTQVSRIEQQQEGPA